MFAVATASLGRFVRTIRAEAWLPAVVVLAGSVLVFALAEPNELTDDPAAEHDRLGSTWAALAGADQSHIIGGLILVLLTSVVFQPFSLAVAEWLARQPTSTVGKALAKPFYGVQRWRRGPLRAQAAGPSVAELRRGTTETASPQAALLSERYPEYETDLRPTLLGNALFVAETRAGDHYGFSWPHLGKFLIAVLAEKGHDPTAAARAQIEVLTGLATAFGCVTVAGVAFLADERAWLLVTLIPLAAAYVAYRAAVRATWGYALSLELAVELHRFELLEALHLALPPDLTRERSMFQELSRSKGRLAAPSYEHPAPAPGSPAEAGDPRRA